MKKILTLALACVAVSAFLISCSSKDVETDSKDTVTPTETPAENTPKPTVTPLPATPTPTQAPVAQEIDYTGKKLVALSFDDGPNLQTTPLVLDKLEKYGVVATFFLIGQNISDETVPVMERQLELGCEIANHSWTHLNMAQLEPEKIKEEILSTTDKIYETVGVTPVFFRPPFISTSDVMYENIDLPFINGINSADWDATVSAEQRAEGILSKVKDGDIILLHDFTGNDKTVEALDAIIQGLIDDGYALVTMSQLFELKGVDPNVENKIWTNTAW
ncbi:polysaccharide deacetylase family protein [Mobilitalea sibirica]|uniref:Polysaccharide deacetylase family protein n=1 Tax=Mobilitalea sibirica TaxID=1462919 RepID=A0A8J7GWZ7_9FIRM|nr:polysaccharide deacetylase family protein [Mobilitalea sibirica]MBH1939504.1 polysaccharide deacetylase family protein [Mobilitalea sibirica]